MPVFLSVSSPSSRPYTYSTDVARDLSVPCCNNCPTDCAADCVHAVHHGPRMRMGCDSNHWLCACFRENTRLHLHPACSHNVGGVWPISFSFIPVDDPWP